MGKNSKFAQKYLALIYYIFKKLRLAMALVGWPRMVGLGWLAQIGWHMLAGHGWLAHIGWHMLVGDCWLAIVVWPRFVGLSLLA